MSVIGTSRHSVGVKLFDNATQDWAASFTPNAYQFYAGQGFEFPTDQTWINKQTGTQDFGGMLMGFPRSAEQPPIPPSSRTVFPEYVKRRIGA